MNMQHHYSALERAEDKIAKRIAHLLSFNGSPSPETLNEVIEQYERGEQEDVVSQENLEIISLISGDFVRDVTEEAPDIILDHPHTNALILLFYYIINNYGLKEAEKIKGFVLSNYHNPEEEVKYTELLNEYVSDIQ